MKQDPSQLEKIIALMPGNVYWKNREGIYLGCNDNNAQLLGLSSRDEIVGKNAIELVGNISLDVAKAVIEADEKIMESNTERVFEEYWSTLDGETITFFTKKIPMHDDQGNVIGLLGISLDITDRKMMENELKQLKDQAEQNSKIANTYLSNMLANLPENFYWVDREGVVLGCNENQAKLFGMASSAELMGKSIYHVAEMLGWDKTVADEIRKNDHEVMETRQTKRIEEVIEIDGVERTFVSFKNPLIDLNGDVMGVFGVSVDITERKKIEIALKEAKQKAEAANEAKSEFIRNMSHDLRTPFNGILGFTQHLLKIENDAAKKDLLSYISESCKKLLNLINEIISLTSLETGQQKLHFVELDIKEVVEDIKILMLAQIKNKKLDLITRYEGYIPEKLINDNVRIHRILLNLVANSIKFTEQGSVTVKINTIETGDKDKPVMLIITVTDTGIGMPQDKLNVIFDRFSRLTTAHQGKYEGSGLGLYIVKQFINELGGYIQVKSEIDVGSEFTCYIPCAVAG